MEKLLWPLFSLLPILGLVKWARNSDLNPPPIHWGNTFLVGFFAIGLCRLVEGGVGIFVGSNTLFWLGAIVPLVEESLRWVAVRVEGNGDVASGTWIGGAMGVGETFLKMGFDGMAGSGHPFRLLASIPLHGLLGGILTKNARWLPIAIGLHGTFNASFFFGSPFSWAFSLSVAWIAGFLWLSVLSEKAAPERETEPAPEEMVSP